MDMDMEAAKMESLEPEDGDGHQSDATDDDLPPRICTGKAYQAEIPNLATEDERRQYMSNTTDSCMALGYDCPIPIMWTLPSEFNKKEEEIQKQHSSETKAIENSRDGDSQTTSICPTSNNTSGQCSTSQDPHPELPDQIVSDSHQAHDDKLAPCSTQEGLNFTDKAMADQGEIEQFIPVPNSSTSIWSDQEAELLLLGLYIFGKNLHVLSRFVGSKTVGDVLSYYYGKFYKGEAYKRWSACRKAKIRRCILGERIFIGWRRQELISRLKSKIPKEAHDLLDEMFKSFNDSQTSLMDFVFHLKSVVGIEAFVEAVAIGKGKDDLTGFVLDPSKPNQVLSVQPGMPAGKDCSSLASEDIIKFLTGDFRRSKTRSNDLFWEAVWPRLLARGWHSEKPNDVSTTKNCLVFIVPGIQRFSRSELTKGTHYFDSVSDVLKKVVADPVLLEIEVDEMGNGVNAEKNGFDTAMKLNQDVPFDGYHELPKFTIIDTSLVQGEEPSQVRELRNLPADANISFGPLRHTHNMVSDSSSDEHDTDDRSSDYKEGYAGVTADENGTEMVSSKNADNESQVDSFRNMAATSCSVFPVNGHSSNGNGDTIGATSFFPQKTKIEKRKYLSPVTKRRRLTSCSNDQTSRRSFSFSKGPGLEKEKVKLPSTSSKPTAIDVGGSFQSKSLASCSGKEKPCQQIKDASNSHANDRSNEKMNVARPKEKPSGHKVDTLASVHSKTAVEDTKPAKGVAQSSDLVANQVKLETPQDDKTVTIAHAPSSDNHGSILKNKETTSSSSTEIVHDAPEATRGGPANPQPDLQASSQAMNPRRQGTRVRPPTARALEAVAFGLLGSGKRKADPTGSSRPRQRARKSTKEAASVSTSSDTEKSSMDSGARQ
uniref:SANT domain-containing protein n=1 Tax=Oryza glumipatula TaxID=40148 RepID=A0A0D9Z788_9ORYZ